MNMNKLTNKTKEHVKAKVKEVQEGAKQMVERFYSEPHTPPLFFTNSVGCNTGLTVSCLFALHLPNHSRCVTVQCTVRKTWAPTSPIPWHILCKKNASTLQRLAFNTLQQKKQPCHFVLMSFCVHVTNFFLPAQFLPYQTVPSFTAGSE
jgi:hypothetical protein